MNLAGVFSVDREDREGPQAGGNRSVEVFFDVVDYQMLRADGDGEATVPLADAMARAAGSARKSLSPPIVPKGRKREAGSGAFAGGRTWRTLPLSSRMSDHWDWGAEQGGTARIEKEIGIQAE